MSALNMASYKVYAAGQYLAYCVTGYNKSARRAAGATAPPPSSPFARFRKASAAKTTAVPVVPTPPEEKPLSPKYRRKPRAPSTQPLPRRAKTAGVIGAREAPRRSSTPPPARLPEHAVQHCSEHRLRVRRLARRADCAHCGLAVRGITFQGVSCVSCGATLHKRCAPHSHCSSFTPPSTSPIVNTPTAPLADYSLQRVIGRGAYATVYLAEQRRTRVPVALKVMSKSSLSDSDVPWLEAECRVAALASECPLLLSLRASFQTRSHLFLVTDVLTGGDLFFHLQRRKCFSEWETRFFAAELTCAISWLHNKEILYRDLKLDNVLLDERGHTRLADFGLCRERLSSGEKAHTFCGTPSYMAPELLSDTPYGFPVDWWALGVLLWELLTGRPPFAPIEETTEALTAQVCGASARPPRSLSVRAAGLLRGLLERDPDSRLGDTALRSHAFFRGIDWDEAAAGRLEPAFVPEGDCVDELFSGEPAILTSPKHCSNTSFDGFNYTEQSNIIVTSL